MEKFTKSVKKYPEEYNSELLEAIRIMRPPYSVQVYLKR